MSTAGGVICVDYTGTKLGLLLLCTQQKNTKLLFKKQISHIDLKIPYIQESAF